MTEHRRSARASPASSLTCPEVAQPQSPLEPSSWGRGPSSWGRGPKAGEGRGHLAWSHCGGHWSRASLPSDRDRGYPREHGIVGPGWEPIAQAVPLSPKVRHTNKAMSLSPHQEPPFVKNNLFYCALSWSRLVPLDGPDMRHPCTAPNPAKSEVFADLRPHNLSRHLKPDHSLVSGSSHTAVRQSGGIKL